MYSNQQQNNKQSNNQEESKKINITVTDIEPFKYPSKSGWITGSDLSVRVNRMFHEIFSDYNGCQFVPLDGRVYVYLYFGEPDKYNDISLPRAFTPIQINKNTSLGMAALQISNYSTNNRRYEITDLGRDVLSQFIFTSNDMKFFDPKRLAFEESIKTPMGGRETQFIMTKCQGFDVDKIVRKVISNVKDEDMVLISFAKPVSYINNSVGRFDNKLYKIEVIDGEEFKNMGLKYNLGGLQNMNYGNPDIVRGI